MHNSKRREAEMHDGRGAGKDGKHPEQCCATHRHIHLGGHMLSASCSTPAVEDRRKSNANGTTDHVNHKVSHHVQQGGFCFVLLQI